jgi:hypothetical protein
MGKEFQQQGSVLMTKTVYRSTAEFLRQIQDKTQRQCKRRNFCLETRNGRRLCTGQLISLVRVSRNCFQTGVVVDRFVLYKYLKFSKKNSWEELVTSV